MTEEFFIFCITLGYPSDIPTSFNFKEDTEFFIFCITLGYPSDIPTSFNFKEDTIFGNSNEWVLESTPKIERIELIKNPLFKEIVY